MLYSLNIDEKEIKKTDKLTESMLSMTKARSKQIDEENLIKAEQLAHNTEKAIIEMEKLKVNIEMGRITNEQMRGKLEMQQIDKAFKLLSQCQE